MAALGAESSSGSSNVSARASSAGALRMLYTRHVDTSATISAAKYLLLRPPQAHGERLALLWTQGENGGVHFRSVLVIQNSGHVLLMAYSRQRAAPVV